MALTSKQHYHQRLIALLLVVLAAVLLAPQLTNAFPEHFRDDHTPPMPVSNPFGTGPDLYQYLTPEMLSMLRMQLLDLSRMPATLQKQMLRGAGAALAASGNVGCNIFGGSGECAALPAESDFQQYCPQTGPLDCVFSSIGNEKIANPRQQMTSLLQANGFPECAACSLSQQRMWCEQSAPKCGTFDRLVDAALPMVTELLSNDSDPFDTIAKNFPNLMMQTSMGLPCRKMCQAVVDSCACGRVVTLGDAIKRALASRAPPEPTTMPPTGLPLEQAKTLFAAAWDEPLCNQFATGQEEGYFGVCEDMAAAVSQDTCAWCSTDKAAMLEEAIALQLLQLLSTNDDKEEHTDSTSPFKPHSSSDPSSSDSQPQPSHSSHLSALSIVTLIFASAAFISAVTVAGLWFFKNQRRPEGETYLSLQPLDVEMEYKPPQL
eukprot:jgi/Chlat1/9277/Chrsp99S00716